MTLQISYNYNTIIPLKENYRYKEIVGTKKYKEKQRQRNTEYYTRVHNSY
jgi:hypothetical protein